MPEQPLPTTATCLRPCIDRQIFETTDLYYTISNECERRMIALVAIFDNTIKTAQGDEFLVQDNLEEISEKSSNRAKFGIKNA